MAAPPERVHHFHGEAHVFEGQLQHPLTGDIKPQNYVKLLSEGGYILEHTKDYRADNIVTFKSAHTHVAGHKSPKDRHGWVTLATSVIEQLNVLEVVTADRVVAQISTEHPLEGHVPTVTFLGTRFENLQIAGIPVKVNLKFPFTTLNPPDRDTTYLNDAGFLKDIGCTQSFPNAQAQFKAYLENSNNPKPRDRANGSLAYGVSLEEGENLGGVKIQGNVITVPEFGKIFLAELSVECDTFYLTMIRLELGCIAAGQMSFSRTITNGSTSP
ncbi:MAG TPA: hypothetical protein VJS37_00465 [Terriglobales bacterium]|nr:hypothetical protein [Terriglobales bacterium]